MLTMVRAFSFSLCLCLLSLVVLTVTSLSAISVAKPGCQTACGNVTIYYPFGIGLNGKCSLSPIHNIYCNSSFKPPKPFLNDSNLEVLNISITGQMRISNIVATNRYQKGNLTYDLGWASTNLTGLPAVFSDTENKLTLIGCDDYVFIDGTLGLGRNYTSGCLAICSMAEDVTNGSCSGIGCCQTSIPKGLIYLEVDVYSFNNHTQVSNFNPYNFAFVGEQQKFNFNVADLNDPTLETRIRDNVPLVLDWFVGMNQTCQEAKGLSTYACQNNTICADFDAANTIGYRCSCLTGYEGNPYLKPGCTGISLGLISMMIAMSWIWTIAIKRNKIIKMREKFFEQNGGVLLKQQLAQKGGTMESSKIFSEEELKAATNNYSEDYIVGKGGYGTVYKGILMDGCEVAIKKSKVVDKFQVEQFINEVVILTQINHRNVVKLLGCCLETEVPMLVYQFISNGTLFEHIHKNKGITSWLTWETCVRLASEAANALMYLHSAASIPIIHRDVKSTNILLNESYTAKISDFGASRLVPMDQAQVTTLVQGTMGYLDPEYLHSSQLTEKSDVYSFGVVLAELLTKEKPLSSIRKIEERNLATYFVLAMKENRLMEILDPQLVREASEEHLLKMAKLVMECLNVKSDDRPTMTEVALELEGLKKQNRHPWENQIEDTTNFIGQQDLYPMPPQRDDHGIASSIELSGKYSMEMSLISEMNYPR